MPPARSRRRRCSPREDRGGAGAARAGLVLGGGDGLRHLLKAGQMHEVDVGVLGREAAPRRARPRAHDRRVGPLQRQRLGYQAGRVKEATMEVEDRLGGPEALEQFDPLRRVLVALVVRAQPQAEHAQLVCAPAGDDVDREAAAGDVIDRRGHPRDDDRVEERHVDGREDADPAGQRGQRRGPREQTPRSGRPAGANASCASSGQAGCNRRFPRRRRGSRAAPPPPTAPWGASPRTTCSCLARRWRRTARA